MSQSKEALRGRAARMAAPTNAIERFLQPKQPIVTKTDLKGKITYANPAFVEISGFSKEELMGQPHNVVRHPDMPKEAFEDLWDTVRNDIPWRGRVKNRCKDGGFYWVDAYVTPLTENGQKIGYMSVRSVPSEADKTAAQSLYEAVRSGAATFPKTSIKKARSLSVDLGAMCALTLGFGAAALLSQGVFQWGFAAAAAASLLGGCAWIRSAIQGPIEVMRASMVSLAEGNFKQEIPTQGYGEFQSLLTGMKSMQVNLRAIVADVVSSAARVRDDAAYLDRLSGDLKERSERQSDGINGVASALEELSVSVSEISEATGKSSEHANEAMTVVAEGTDRMAQSISATEQVVSAVDIAQMKINELTEAVDSISHVTQTIKDIAEKTNLLALNAAIEAARAGESGRGFSVVADEVRKLAEMTRSSTAEISSTVSQVQKGTQEALDTMKRAVNEVNNGTEMIQGANQSLANIARASKGVAQSAQDIASMLDQQSQASTEVANSMERMSQLTESNVASISDVRGAAEQLKSTAESLRELVVHFEKSL